MNVASRASVALAVAATCCAASPGADEAAPPEEFYRMALAQMQHVAEPPFVTYRTSVPSGHTSVIVRSDPNGYAKVSIRASTLVEPARTWDVAYRGADGAASIALPDGHRAITGLALFDPTWRGAFRWMRRGITGTDAVEPPPDESPDVVQKNGGTPPPVIAVVEAFGTNSYSVEDGGPTPCADGRDGRHLHLVARGDPVTHPLTDVVVDTQSMRFCTMRFHQTVRGGLNKGYFDIDLHFGEVGGYYLITDGKVTGGIRAYLFVAFNLDTAFTYDAVALPRSLPPDLFEPRPGAQFTPAPL
jgi:hypothetical protein